MRRWLVRAGLAAAVTVWMWATPSALLRRPEPSEELIRLLQATTVMWNRGDLDGFMAPYAASATYMTPGGLIGVDAMRARYLEKYFTGSTPDQQLRFDALEVRALGGDHALMTGRYTLAGGGKTEQTGRFTLVWTRTPAGWRILHDHSS